MRKSRVPLLLIIFFIFPFQSIAESHSRVFSAKYAIAPDGNMTLLFKGFVPRRTDRLEAGIQEIRYPQFFSPEPGMIFPVIVEIFGLDRRDVLNCLLERGVKPAHEAELFSISAFSDEAVTIVNSGPVENRLDFVFLGDGYTQEEKGKFFADISRLVEEMFIQETFRSYLPLFNVHAVFRPSNVSGIGNGEPADTAYRLYRIGDTLRAIYCENHAAARTSAQAAPDCDVPVIIANDLYYGGLGGEFAISTCSVNNGTAVLRHELGHTLGITGDEYDGGSFFGANFSPELSGIPWTAWLSGGEHPIAEPLHALYIGWPWHRLSTGAYELSFNSPGGYSYRLIRFSSSGLGDSRDDLNISLDGNPISFVKSLEDDRYFYDISFDGGFSSGPHTLRFAEEFADNNNWLCSLSIHEFGADYHFEEGYIGAYPVFDADENSAGYRPVDDSCLMRNMNSSTFCPVCRENLWFRILDRISLIEEVDFQIQNDRIRTELKVPGLGQFRAGAESIPGEILRIRRFRFDREQTELADALTWDRPVPQARGKWRVEVELVTPEVRSDPVRILVHRREFDILAEKQRKDIR